MSQRNALNQKRTRRLERRLAAYSLAAGAVIGGAGAYATVHYTETNVTLNTFPSSFDILFGGENKFSITLAHNVGGWNLAAVGANTANAMWRGTSMGTFAIPLDKGDAVKGGYWGNNPISWNMAGYVTASSYTGNFRDTTNKYLGVRFFLSGNTNYGWVAAQVNSNVTEVKITGYAYNDSMNGGIEAGSIVPEAGSLALLALGATGLAAWRKKRA